MKVLIASRNKEILKKYPNAMKVGHPHIFTKRHIEQVKKAFGKGTSIIMVGSKEDAAKHLGDVEIVAGFPMTIPDVSKASRLRWIHSFSAGVDSVLTPFVKKSKILLSNSSGIHATPIAEHLVGFILMFIRGFYGTFENQTKRLWKKNEMIGELRGKHVLIVGAGEIGMETARLLHPFGAYISATTRRPKQKPRFIDEMGKASDLDKMLPRADFILVTLPYTDATHHLFDRKKFKRMKKTAVIMNIGRGGIINEKDLVGALRRKDIFGAALDVTEEEPLSSKSPLWNMKNVIITPHHSGLSDQYMNRAIDLFCKNIKAYRARKELPTEVDKALGY